MRHTMHRLHTSHHHKLPLRQCGLAQLAADIPKPCRCVAAAATTRSSGSRRRARSSGSNKARRQSQGFGRKEDSSQARQDLAPLDDDSGQDGMSQRPEYQMYADPGYKPQRFIGPLQVQPIPGQGRGLVCTAEQELGDLLILSSAMMRLEGEFQVPPPDAEALHKAWTAAGVTAAQRRVLDVLYDGSPESESKEVSLSTLDVKFWQGRGRHDPQAPQVSPERVLSVLEHGACLDTQQDAASMTLRHQKPNSYIGLWPEYTFLNHSCVPNTAITVVQDRLLVHAARPIAAGEQLTRNYIPHVSAAPASVRQAALKEAGYEWRCNCERCQLEERASEGVRDVLQAAYTWYTEEAVPRFSAANEGEDLTPLRELLEEAETLVKELEEVVDAEPGLTDEERTLLRTAAYDTYDMMLMCDEFVHQDKTATPLLLSCLELLWSIAPGSDSHVAVALKYDRTMQNRLQLLEALLKKENIPRTQANLSELKKLKREAEAAEEYRLVAWVSKYGNVSYPILEGLTEAYEVFIDGLEQMSIMASQGQQEQVNELDINGVKVSVIDKADLSAPPQGSRSRKGVRLSVQEDDDVAGAADEEQQGSGVQGEGEVVDVEAEVVQAASRDLDQLPEIGEISDLQAPGEQQPKARKLRIKRKQR